ncbi:rhodanese-like domain-containing protein [Geomonas sp. Red69]|uniref:Rhodanese-like domain-containing protein n=1 Tax=Geomonas diazotrophica TaxID=2843197 RepID=A0ABX8JKH8_9BACT|nr:MULTISPECIES: rhodanese-like domain-containing protein [Geomonas]MBU5638592.1 rhodanese-like domain-containing protein [Geomonas diazotrophica]QWV97134.1 rhodanese-like domain-containing protein [Geomonas nitrogeniifigens]QXE86306.1 rhodanese-like domain-containing protein [Geomonas nitrogeniifigens]
MRFIAVLFSVLMLTASLSQAVGPANVTSKQAQALLAKNARMVLLDVRTPDEYRQAHLKGAQLIPLGELNRRVQEIPRDRPVLVYCAVGARSSTAASFLSSRGYREIYNMTDGIVGWYNNGLPLQLGR